MRARKHWDVRARRARRKARRNDGEAREGRLRVGKARRIAGCVGDWRRGYAVAQRGAEVKRLFVDARLHERVLRHDLRRGDERLARNDDGEVEAEHGARSRWPAARLGRRASGGRPEFKSRRPSCSHPHHQAPWGPKITKVFRVRRLAPRFTKLALPFRTIPTGNSGERPTGAP